MKYRLPEADFELPDGYFDQSVTVLSLGPDGSPPLRILITRGLAAEGVSVSDYAESDIASRRRAQEGFDLLWRRDHVLDGRPAVITASRAEEQGDPVAERHAYVLNGRAVLTIAFTTSGEFSAEQMKILHAFNRSFVFRNED
ncbi:DcrB-related protein [Brytella acorum]|uniref:DcrB-related protein n=1 Tax=Brytella acorum TaxID=2959299 RepID=A0AA35XYM5_9PROT|nr:DcrB-related protein [Brytella acorum]CAI9121496.1 DcrB-related protein [Brytella acorum]